MGMNVWSVGQHQPFNCLLSGKTPCHRISRNIDIVIYGCYSCLTITENWWRCQSARKLQRNVSFSHTISRPRDWMISDGETSYYLINTSPCLKKGSLKILYCLKTKNVMKYCLMPCILHKQFIIPKILKISQNKLSFLSYVYWTP